MNPTWTPGEYLLHVCVERLPAGRFRTACGCLVMGTAKILPACAECSDLVEAGDGVFAGACTATAVVVEGSEGEKR